MKLKKKIINIILHPYSSYQVLQKIIFDKYFQHFCEEKAKQFFVKNNEIEYFKTVKNSEIGPEFLDLKRLYNLIINRKPRCVLEFGSGFSTIAITLALRKNYKKNKILGKLFSIDGNEKWLENTKNKFHEDLADYVKFYYSKPYISKFKDQLVTYHEVLPDISPNFIYLDGPAPNDVVNSINGLTFNSKIIEKGEEGKIFFEKNTRRIVSADILMYESTSPSDFFILVDKRYSNANVLEKSLLFDYIIKKKLHFGGSVSFEKKYQPYP